MIYLIILILLIILTLTYDFNSKKKFSNKWYNFILIIFILLAGLRYKVGGDTLSYFDSFEYVKSLGNTNLSDLLKGRHGFLWNVFAALCKSISKDFVLLQLVQAIFVNTTLFWFIKKYSKFKFTSLLIYFLFAYLYFNMEIMRESIAISFFLLAYPFFEKKSWLKYYMFATIAFLFHASAIIVFLFPFFRFIKFSVKNLIFISIFFLGFVILLANNPELMNLLLISETIETKFNVYSEYALNINGKLFVLISFIAFPLFLIRMNRKIEKHGYSLFENVYIIYFMLAISYLIFSGFSRFVNYITPFMIIYLADILNNIYSHNRFRNTKRLLVAIIVIIAFIPKYLYYSADTSRFYPNTTKFNLYYPYSSVFNKKEYVFRRIIFIEGMQESADKK